MTKRKVEYWVIPPQTNAEFVAHMEEVLETYEEAYDSAHPVLCMDEQPVQLLKETRISIEATARNLRKGLRFCPSGALYGRATRATPQGNACPH